MHFYICETIIEDRLEIYKESKSKRKDDLFPIICFGLWAWEELR